MFVLRLCQRLVKIQIYFHFARLLWAITQLPISTRKGIISICQMGEWDYFDMRNVSLPPLYDISTGQLLSRSDFLHAVRDVTSSVSKRSLAWMVARTCPEPIGRDESETVRRDGFFKEVHASQNVFSDTQKVSYSAFFRNYPGINDPGKWWIDQVHDISKKFLKEMDGKLLYPKVNRQKNTSDETHREYNKYVEKDYVRTVDLEILYHKTGIQVGGNCELRSAWKFNDLKPRLYYCIGGQQYWSSRYIKTVAVKIMEAIPSTRTKLRVSPQDFLSSSLLNDYVMAWDFTSFTTTLSELKYFIWNLARVAEKAGTLVYLFDYRFGYLPRLLSELLDEYNEISNMNAPFEIHRFVGMYMEENELSLYQANSGMLGVPGNIGFSTALHGFIICRECGQHRCVCVGDDGLGITPEDPNSSLVPAVQAIGIINPEKFGKLEPGEDEMSIKFLKRKWKRVGNLFTLDFLLDFPASPYIDGITGHRTVPIDFSMEARIWKFCTHVGALLWDVQKYSWAITDEDLDLIITTVRMGYSYLNLPITGAFPGMTILSGEKAYQIGHMIPPLRNDILDDPRRVDWIDSLIRHSPSLFFRTPVYTPRVPYHEHMEVGETRVVCEDQYWSALEDIGMVETQAISEWMRVDNVATKGLLKRTVRHVDDGTGKAMVVKCVKDIPDHFFAGRSKTVVGGAIYGDEADEIFG